jgi:Uma2 family endonuclease
MGQKVELRPADYPELFLSHPDALYEVEDGQVVELPSMGALAVFVASNLCDAIRAFIRGRRLGRSAPDVNFIVDPVRDTRRRPDVAFVSYDRWPADRPVPEEDWEVIPDLAVEVLSPSDQAGQVSRKIQEYFGYGVRQVWVVNPFDRTAAIHTSPSEVKVLSTEDELDGGEILPGFTIPIAPLFRTTEE